MVINTNIAAQNSANALNKASSMLNESLARLSSGSKIVSPADDPAGMAESISLTAQVNQTQAANSNVSNAISFLQTQDGYLQQVGSALDEMAKLSVQSQDVTKTDNERLDYQAEFTTLAGYITDTATKDFNGVSLFTGAALDVTTDGNGATFQMAGINLGTAAYNSATGASVSTTTTAAAALTAVTSAITQLATDRATVGASVERLTYTSSQLNVLTDNLTAANSQITDVDVAQESTNYAKYQILTQSATAMLAQANQNPQSVLKLLQ
ncbi:MAG TPA: flagellin [Verrucomicrobiae bacterium]|jgi:flagellin|nr:flagellin [Verrucomicrobiae bacterium]